MVNLAVSPDIIQRVVRDTVVQIVRQKTIYLQDIKHPGLELCKPLPVFLEYEGNTVIANYYDTESFGYGDSEYEALNDLCTELAQTYLDLAKEADHLGPLPQKWWDNLRTLIRRKNDVPEEA